MKKELTDNTSGKHRRGIRINHHRYSSAQVHTIRNKIEIEKKIVAALEIFGEFEIKLPKILWRLV